MKQYPKTIKFKKNHKIKKSFLILKSQKIFLPLKNAFFIKAIEGGKLKLNQIEACRRSVRRNLKKNGSLRMGSGKGKHAI
jgi:ribosomal protein L16/L10AE